MGDAGLFRCKTKISAACGPICHLKGASNSTSEYVYLSATTGLVSKRIGSGKDFVPKKEHPQNWRCNIIKTKKYFLGDLLNRFSMFQFMVFPIGVLLDCHHSNDSRTCQSPPSFSAFRMRFNLYREGRCSCFYDSANKINPFA